MTKKFEIYAPGGQSAATALEQYEMALLRAKDLSHSEERLNEFKSIYETMLSIGNLSDRRAYLVRFACLAPSSKPFETFFIEVCSKAIAEASTHEDATHRKSELIRLIDAIPDRQAFFDLYSAAITAAIETCDKIDDKFTRRYSLADIAERLKNRPEFEPLMLFALKTSLGLSERTDFRKYSLEDIAKELPKSCDVEVYRKHTFLGLAFSLPHRGEFLELFKRSIKTAIDATELIQEPYYKKYALFFLASKLPKAPEFTELEHNTFYSAFKAIDSIPDQFARQYGFHEFLKNVPRTQDYATLIIETVEKSLPFFSLRGHLSDLEPLEVFDYFIVADEKKMTDSKKKRFTREHYSQVFAKELSAISAELHDIRLLELLRPYTHVWIRPIGFRNSMKKIVTELEAMRSVFHGREIERPVYHNEVCYGVKSHAKASSLTPAVEKDTISIDLGATNTVVMRRKGSHMPEYIDIAGLTRRFGDVITVPTAVDADTGAIGAGAIEHTASLNIKKLFLEGDKRGAELMEKFFTALFARVRETAGEPGWFRKLTGKSFDRICVTVPVGFESYTQALGDIISRSTAGSELLFVEEPLAAALGYRVAEKRDKFVVIADFGGCTLDTMLIRISSDEVHVVAKPERSRMLGGRDIDHWLASRLNAMRGMKDAPHSIHLLLEAEKLKIALSTSRSVPFDFEGGHYGTVTREDFETLLAERGFYDEVDRELSNILKKAAKLGVYKEMVEAVLITGGTSIIPSFKEKIAHFFPELARNNAIYDSSPLSAVAAGAALYGTSGVIDPHLSMAYAVRHHVPGTDRKFAYEIVLEKGQTLPFEKTFKINPARTLGPQREMFIELFEVPDSLITRRWIADGGMEFIRQIVSKTPDELSLRAFKTVTLSFAEHIDEETEVTFCVDEAGNLSLRYGSDNKETLSGIRLQ